MQATNDAVKNASGLAADILAIAEVRAGVEGLQRDTLSRHRSAINAMSTALNGSAVRIVRPGFWVSMYSREPSTSTVISNMKFVASILEWTESQQYEQAPHYLRIAGAIRQALAVRA